MKRSLKLLMSALTALILPAFGWAEDVVYTWTGKTSAAMTESIDLTKYESIAVQIAFKSLGTYASINNNDVALRIGSAEGVADGFGIKYKKGGGWGTFFFVGDTTSGNIATVGSTTNLTYDFTADVSEDGQTLNNISTITWTGSGGATTSGSFTPTASQSLKTSTLGYVTVNTTMPDDVTITITATPIPDRVTYVRTVSGESDWSADAAWAKETDATATATVPVDDNNVTLTVNADSTVTMNAAATLYELTIDGDYALTLTGSETLNANTTVINTDTDVSAIKANLGAVTIAADKTLTVGANVTASVANGANSGTIHVTGGTENAPVVLNCGTAANDYAGAITVAADSVLRLHATGGNKAYNVTGNGGTSRVLLTSGQDWGVTDNENSKFNNCVLEIPQYVTGTTANKNFWLTPSKIGSDVHLVLNRQLTFENDSNAGTLNIASLSGASNIVANGSHTIKITNGAGKTYSGVIQGTHSVVKEGAGEQTLSGTNTYSGTTTVSGGILKVTGSLGSGDVTVNANGTLTYAADTEPANTFTGDGTITADGCTLDFAKDADITGYTGAFALANSGTLVIPAGKEGSMVIPAGSTLKLVIADTVDSHDASAVTGDGTFMFVDSTGEQITDGVEGKVFTRSVSTTPVCMGDNAVSYTSIAAAIEAGSSFAMLVAPVTEDVTLTNGFSLQTYGQTITGNVTVASGATLVAQAGGIVGTLTFEDGAAMTVENAQDFTVSSTVTFPTSGTFNLTMPSAPAMGNSLPFIVSGLALADDDVKVGTLSFTVSGGTANTTDYKLISTSTGTYEVATVATPACTLDGTNYASLEEAINVIAADGYTGDGTITLSTALILSSTLVVDIGDENTLTINLAGNGITCYAQDSNSNFVPAIIVESGKLNLVSDVAASVLTYTTTIIVGTETSTAPALTIGQNVTVGSMAATNAVNVVKGSVGGIGTLLIGGDAAALTLAADTKLDATVGTLTLSQGSYEALLAATAPVTVLVVAEAKAGDVVIVCDTEGLDAAAFTVSGAENLGVSLDGDKITLVSTLVPTAQVGEQPYMTIAEALAVENVTAVTIIADSAEDVSLPAGVTLTVADKVTYTGKVTDSYGTELVRNNTTGTYTVPTYVAAATTANGTAGYTTLAEAAAVADVTGLTLLADVDVTSDVTITVPVSGAHTVTVKSGATLDIAAATYTNDATKTFADGVNIATEEGATVTLTSGGGYFSITGEGTVQAVGGANFIYGLGGVQNTISANLVIPAEKALNVRAWSSGTTLGGGNITVNGTITANGGNDGALKLKVASGKTLVATSAIGVPVVLADGAILDATNAITVNAAVTTEGTVTVNKATAGETFLTYTGDAPANAGATYLTEAGGLYAAVVHAYGTTLLSFSKVTVPAAGDTVTAEEAALAAQYVANALALTSATDEVTAITNPEVVSVIDGVGIELDGTTATFTYDFGVSALTVDGEYVIVTVELGEGLDFADGASVTLVTGDGDLTDAVAVDENGDFTLTPSGSTRYFKTSLTSPFKVKAKASK